MSLPKPGNAPGVQQGKNSTQGQLVQWKWKPVVMLIVDAENSLQQPGIPFGPVLQDLVG